MISHTSLSFTNNSFFRGRIMEAIVQIEQSVTLLIKQQSYPKYCLKLIYPQTNMSHRYYKYFLKGMQRTWWFYRTGCRLVPPGAGRVEGRDCVTRGSTIFPLHGNQQPYHREGKIRHWRWMRFIFEFMSPAVVESKMIPVDQRSLVGIIHMAILGISIG